MIAASGYLFWNTWTASSTVTVGKPPFAMAALLEDLSTACEEVVSFDDATAELELLFCAGSEFPVLFCVHPANNPRAAIPNKIVVFFMFHFSN